MLLYYLFWMFNGLYYTLLYYFLGLTYEPEAQPRLSFLPISVFRRKGISNGIQTERNLREHLFWNKRNPGDLEWTSRKQRGGHEVGGRAQGGRRAPHPCEPLVAPPTYFFRLYILLYPKTSRVATIPLFHHRNLLYS